MKKQTRFIILSTQRTGSSWLMDLLNNIEGNECHGELLLPQPVEKPPMAGCSNFERYIERKKRHLLGIRPFSVFSYLNTLYKRPVSVGFKLMYSQLKLYPEILPYLITRQIRIIHLVRRNLLDIIVSSELARSCGVSHQTSRDKDTIDSSVYLEPRELISGIERLRKNEIFIGRVLRFLPCSRIQIHYEELRKEPLILKQILKFLNLDRQDELPRSNLVKRQKRKHSESIRNFEEIRETLKAKGWGHLINV